MLIATHHKQLKPTATALFVFLVMFLSAYAHSNPVLNEAIKHSPPVCAESLMLFKKYIPILTSCFNGDCI